MIVTFALQAENKFSPVLPRALSMINSIKDHLPKAKIIQLSNEKFPGIGGVDEVQRLPYEGDFIEWALNSMVKLMERGEDVLQIATDVLLKANVSEVFNDHFDVAACRYPLRDRSDGAFCGDVNFIHSSGLSFWQDVLEMYLKSNKRDGWEGGQTAFLEVVNRNRYNVKELDYDIYCRTPEALNQDVTRAKILHFRGPRKTMMASYA